MVSIIQNQKVEKRREGMLVKVNTGRENSGVSHPHSTITSFRSNADVELRRYSRNIDDYARTIEVRSEDALKRSKPLMSDFIKSRNKDARTIDTLLKEWEEDRLNKTGGAIPLRTSRKFSADQTNREAGAKSSTIFSRIEKHPLVSRTIQHVTQIQQIPVLIAMMVSLVALLSVWIAPATFLTGLVVNHSVVLPTVFDSDSALSDYIRPMSEDNVSVDLSSIDTKKFDMLVLRDYVVQPTDTINKIANRFNLHIDTIISFNKIANPRSISQGQSYKIPNRDGLLYKVLSNDTLDSVSKKFGVSVISLLDGNNLSDEHLVAGNEIFIPDARMNPVDLKLLLGELFMWPVYGSFSSNFGYRSDPFTGVRMFHNGIDIAGYIGEPVKAGMEGRVIDIQSQVGNYGKVIIIKHPRGLKTLYGHLSAFNVEVGQYVSQGQVIARMGNTGRSTGPHLHFSVIINGTFVNPLRYLK